MYADIALFMIAFIVFTLSLVRIMGSIPFSELIISRLSGNVKYTCGISFQQAVSLLIILDIEMI